MQRPVLAPALVALVAILVLAPNDPRGRVPDEDAGVFFYAARVLLDGGTPYLDIWDHKPPLVYVIDAVGLALGGPTGVWVVEIVSLVVAAWLSLLALTRAFGKTAALAGTIAWLLAAPRLFLTDGAQSSYAEFFALPLQFASLAILARGVRVGARSALALGVFAALAFLLKPTLIGTWLAFGLVALATLRVAGVRLVAIALGGTAVVLLIAATLLATRGALGEMLDQALRYNLAYSAFAPFAQRLTAIPEGVRLTSPSGLAPVALGAFAYALATRRALSGLLLVAIVALPIEVLAATSGRAYHYYFLAWLPAMAVLCAFGVSEILRVLEPRRGLALIAVALLAMGVQPARLVTRLATQADDGRVRAAARLIDERTSADDTVLVWGGRSEIFTLADRRSPTRFVYQYAPVATRGYATPAAVDALIADVTAARPALIIDASTASFVTPPLDHAGFASFISPEPQYVWPADTLRFIELVEREYARDGMVAGTDWTVWRRR